MILILRSFLTSLLLFIFLIVFFASQNSHQLRGDIAYLTDPHAVEASAGQLCPQSGKQTVGSVIYNAIKRIVHNGEACHSA